MEQDIGACGERSIRGSLPDGPYPSPAVVSAAPPAPRVLVVDDGRVNQRVAILLLSKLGVEADAASNGLEALAAIERTPYSLVLMDCHMPEMDGLAACRELRRRESGRCRLPVVAMTAGADEDVSACLEAGMDACLPKPVRSADLEHILQAWTAPVSREAVARLEDLMGGPEGLAALVREFVHSGAAPFDIARSGEGAAGGAPLSAAAHSLKGASLNFGAQHLAYLCSRLESLAETGRAPACREFADAAALEFERVRRALERLVADRVLAGSVS